MKKVRKKTLKEHAFSIELITSFRRVWCPKTTDLYFTLILLLHLSTWNHN